MSPLRAPDLLGGLRHHWVVVVAIAVLGAAAGAAGTLVVPDTYLSSAQVRVLHDTRSEVLEDQSPDTYETVDEANRRMASVAATALSDAVVGPAADDVGRTPVELREHLSVEPLTGADVLVFTGTADDPQTAARITQAAVDSFLEVTRETGVQQFTEGADDLDAQANALLEDAGDPVPPATTQASDQLYTRAYELRTRAAVYQGLGELVTAARPPSATAAPGPVRGAGFGVGGGLLAGVAIALLLSTRPTRRPTTIGAPVVAPDPA